MGVGCVVLEGVTLGGNLAGADVDSALVRGVPVGCLGRLLRERQVGLDLVDVAEEALVKCFG